MTPGPTVPCFRGRSVSRLCLALSDLGWTCAALHERFGTATLRSPAGEVIGKGEVVVIDESFGVRVTEVVEAPAGI